MTDLLVGFVLGLLTWLVVHLFKMAARERAEYRAVEKLRSAQDRFFESRTKSTETSTIDPRQIEAD